MRRSCARRRAAASTAGWRSSIRRRSGRRVAAAFDAAYPGPRYLGLPCAPVIQTYDDAGPALVLEQIAEARRRGAASVSIYVVETATDDELRAVAAANAAPAVAIRPSLREVAAAYVRGAIAILDHGTPAELAAWGRLFDRAGLTVRGSRVPASRDALSYLRTRRKTSVLSTSRKRPPAVRE